MNVVAKVARKVVKKRIPIIKNSSNSNDEISLPPSKELYIVLEH
jgi:hypothetical protein